MHPSQPRARDPPPSARQALRLLDDLRIQHGRLDAPVPVGQSGGSLPVELNHTDPDTLPAGFRFGDNDTRILRRLGWLGWLGWLGRG